MGGLFSGFDVVTQGARLTPNMVLTYMGAIYTYHVLQCPMEAISGRQSAWHNFCSGAILGYVGVRSHRLGIPFLDAYFFLRYPQVSPPVAGAVVYGCMGGFLATLGGKPL